MKVSITGHSTGIGRAFYETYQAQGHDVFGFSRSNFYNISFLQDRQRILEKSLDSDVFVNNAYDFKSETNFQLILLKNMVESWKDQDKVIINISSTAGDFPEANKSYNRNKYELDRYINIFNLKRHPLFLMNVKPWYTDVDRLKDVVIDSPKLTCQAVVDAVLDLTDLRHKVWITSSTIYPKPIYPSDSDY